MSIYIYIWPLYLSPSVMDLRSITWTNKAPGDPTLAPTAVIESRPVGESAIFPKSTHYRGIKALTVQLKSRPSVPPNHCRFRPTTTPTCHASASPPSLRPTMPPCRRDSDPSRPRSLWLHVIAALIRHASALLPLRSNVPSLSHSTPPCLQSAVPLHYRCSGSVTPYKMT
jgi:hypothetical protein